MRSIPNPKRRHALNTPTTLIASGGLLLLAQVPVHGSYLPNILPGMMLVAFGVGPVFVGVTAAANTGATTKQPGVVAAIMNSSQQVGGALGLAIFSAIATSETAHLLASGHMAQAAATAGFDHALLAGAAFAAAAALISLRTANTRQDPMQAGPQPPQQPPNRAQPGSESAPTQRSKRRRTGPRFRRRCDRSRARTLASAPERAPAAAPAACPRWTTRERAGPTGTDVRNRVPKRASLECCVSRGAPTRPT